jgi:hypothetical protein
MKVNILVKIQSNTIRIKALKSMKASVVIVTRRFLQNDNAVYRCGIGNAFGNDS